MTLESIHQNNSSALSEDALKEARLRIREGLNLTEKGHPANTIANCRAILEQDPVLRGAVRFNRFTGTTDLCGALPWSREGTRLSDRDMPYIREIFEGAYGITYEQRILSALDIVAGRSAFHPVCDVLESLKWDGVPRVDHALHHFLGADDDPFSGSLLRLFMLGAAERVFRPGCKFEYMLCLTGGQGAGKSAFARFLALKDEWFTDDLHRLDDENVYRRLSGHWIIEVSEMAAASNTRSVEEIKSFLSRQSDTYKVPYDRFPADHPRQCALIGTTNRPDFLPRDYSGNRRFLPVQVEPSKAEAHILADEAVSREYFRQMWAEIMVLRPTGEYSLCLTPQQEEQLDRRRREHTREDSRAGQLCRFMDQYRGDRVCSRLLYRDALGHGSEEPKQKDIWAITGLVNEAILGGNLTGWRVLPHPHTFPEFGRQRGWERVPQEELPPEQPVLPSDETNGGCGSLQGECLPAYRPSAVPEEMSGGAFSAYPADPLGERPSAMPRELPEKSPCVFAAGLNEASPSAFPQEPPAECPSAFSQGMSENCLSEFSEELSGETPSVPPAEANEGTRPAALRELKTASASPAERHDASLPGSPEAAPGASAEIPASEPLPFEEPPFIPDLLIPPEEDGRFSFSL